MKCRRRREPRRTTVPEKPHASTYLPLVDFVAHKQDRQENAKELACRRDGRENERREVAYRVQDEHLTHRAAHAEENRVLQLTAPRLAYSQTDLVLEQELHAGLQLLREERGHERHEDAVHVQHLLEAQRGGLVARHHDVLLHAAHSVHAERKGEEDQSQIAVGLRADLLVVAGQLEHYS